MPERAPELADRLPAPGIDDPRELRVGPVPARVWSLDLARLPALTNADLASLSDAERRRAAGFADARVRSRFLTTRVWTRRILALESGVSPDCLDLRIGPCGKPYVTRVASAKRLHFNLSHSGARALLGVCRQAEIGIDIERVRAGIDATRLARRFFSAEEQAVLRACAIEDRPTAFMRCWVRREARLKAWGSTVWRELIEHDSPASCTPAAGIDDDPYLPAPTRVIDLDEAAPYVAAVAVVRRTDAIGGYDP